MGAGCGWPRELRAALAGCSAGDPRAEVVEDLNRRPLEHGCDAVRDFPEQHDARHGNVVGRDAAEPGQHLVGADELSAVQPPGEGDEQLGCLVLGRGEEVVMRRGPALFLLRGAVVRPDRRILCGRRPHPYQAHPWDAFKLVEREMAS